MRRAFASAVCGSSLAVQASQRRHQAQRAQGQKDLYNVLGVQRGAKENEVKKAYLQKAKKLHPDVNPSPKAAEEFSEVKKAYEVLSDPQKRSMYDMTGNSQGADQFGQGGGGFPGGFPGAGGKGGFNPFEQAGGQGGQGGFQNPFGGGGGAGGDGNFSFKDFEEMFEKVGGTKADKAKKPQGPEPGADIHYKLKLSFLEAVNGATKEISFNTMRKCQACGGGGSKENQEKSKCPHCNRGKKVMSTGFFHMQKDCDHCGGTGQLSRATCTQCAGKGIVKDRVVQNLPVPKGVDSKERLKISGKGEAGLRNGPPGNLYVELSVEDHPVFHRDGVDIHMVAPITLSQAVLGGPIRIPTLTGEVETKVPAGTQQGDKIVIRGRGIHRPTQQKTGDFYIHFAVMLPKALSEAQKQAIVEFSKDEKPSKLSDPQLQELKGRYKSWFAAA